MTPGHVNGAAQVTTGTGPIIKKRGFKKAHLGQQNNKSDMCTQKLINLPFFLPPSAVTPYTGLYCLHWITFLLICHTLYPFKEVRRLHFLIL